MVVEFYFTLMKIYPFQGIANLQYEATSSLERIEIKMVVEFYFTLMKIYPFQVMGCKPPSLNMKNFLFI